MSTGATVALVLGVGAAAVLLLRGQTQQQSALAAAVAGGSGVPAAGGGVAGGIGRLWNTWKSDPLGVNEHRKALNDTIDVVKSGYNTVAGAVSEVGSFIKGIF